MAGNKRESSYAFPRWLIVLALFVLIPLAADFNARIVTVQQMRQEEAQLTRDLATEQARQAQLQQQLEYVRSDAYVENWARVEARMARPGEIAVVPVAPEPTYTPVALATPAPQPSSPFDEWWALFFEPFSFSASLP